MQLGPAHGALEANMLTRDDLIRERRTRGGNLPGLLLVYSVLVGTMAGTALAIL